MPSQTNTNITSIDAFIQEIITYAVANAGFTLGVPTFDPGNGDTVHWVSRTTNGLITYWTFRDRDGSFNNYSDQRMECRMMHEVPDATTYANLDDGQEFFTNMGVFYAVPNFPTSKIYTDGTNIFVVLEAKTGVFTHLAFGNLSKVGTYVGGEFLSATNFSDFVAVPGISNWRPITSGNANCLLFSERRYSGSTSNGGVNYVRQNLGGDDRDDYIPFGTDSPVAGLKAFGTIPPSLVTTTFTMTSGTFSPTFFTAVQTNAPSPFNLRAPLMPVYIFRRNDAKNKVEPLGHIPNISSVRIDNLNPKEIVNTDWDVYPTSSKIQDPTITSDSGPWGIAYRDVP